MEPHFKPYGGVDPLSDMVSWNVKRRQLSASQRAEIARALKPMFEVQANARMVQAQGKPRGRKSAMESLPQQSGMSRDQAAAVVGASGRSVQDAEYVHRRDPELSAKIKAGQMTVNAAKREVKRREVQKSMATQEQT